MLGQLPAFDLELLVYFNRVLLECNEILWELTNKIVMLTTLRSKILVLFTMSSLISGGALLYALGQFKEIGQGLYAINACYLPVSDETTKLDLIVFQLQREQEQLSPRASSGFLNAEFYIKELREGLNRTQTIIQLAQRARIVENPEDLTQLLSKSIETQETLQQYETTYHKWHTGEEPLKSLNKQKSQLVVSIRQLASMVAVQMIQVSQETELSRQRAQRGSGTLTGLAATLWIALLFIVLRLIRPITELTTEVQRVTQGEPVKIVDNGISSEISVLYQEFNHMAQAVRERDRRLLERAETQKMLSIRLQQTIDSIPLSILVLENGLITLANTTAKTVWGLKVQTGIPTWIGQVSQTEVSHGDRLVNIEIHRFGTSGDIVVLEDVTEKVAAREQINRNQRLALIGNMLAQVTHEIRNPLNAMSLNVEMLSDEPLSELGQEMLSIIQTEISRLEESTHRYLSLSRSPDVTLEPIDPSEIVNGLIQYEGQGLTFKTSGDSAMVTVDSNILRRCLRNIFRNATEANCHQICIRYHTDHNALYIQISNDGTPMIPAEQSKVFEPFFTTKAQGTGLGLAICKQELEYFQSTLELLPNHTTTTFQITIPRFTS